MAIPAKNEASPSPTIRMMFILSGFGYGFAKMVIETLITLAHLIPLLFFWTVFAALIFSGNDPLNLIESILEVTPQETHSVITSLFARLCNE